MTYHELAEAIFDNTVAPEGAEEVCKEQDEHGVILRNGFLSALTRFLEERDPQFNADAFFDTAVALYDYREREV